MKSSVSALITTYNRANIVLDAINSVFTQSHPVDELIIVDDGSTDHTASAINALIHSAPIPCRYIRKSNGGMASSLNRGIDEAQFEYIAFLDDDDLWATDHIEQSIKIIRSIPSLGCVMGLREKDGVLQWPPEKLLKPYERYTDTLAIMYDNTTTRQHEQNLLIHRRQALRQPFYTAALGTSVVKKELVYSLRFDPEVGARLDIYFFWLLSELTDIALHLYSHGVARQFRVSYISTDDDAPQELKDEIVLKRNADEIRMLRKIVSKNGYDSSEVFMDLLAKTLIGRMYNYRQAGGFLEALKGATDCIGVCNFKDIIKEIFLAFLRIRPRNHA